MLVFLTGCARTPDAEQLRVCRSALPALAAPGQIRLLEAEALSEPARLLLTYETIPDEGVIGRHTLECQFAGEGLSVDKSDLRAVVVDGRALSETHLYFLKRFYLETPEGVSGNLQLLPASPLPEMPASLAYPMQQFFAGLPRTAIYGVLAAAYALIFGLVGRINLAFGELAAVGSAATVAGAALVTLGLGIEAPLAGLAGGLAAALFAGAIYGAIGGYFTIGRITAKSPQPSLIATVGLSLALMEYLRLVQSPVTVWLPPVWSTSIPVGRAGTFVVNLTPISLVTTGIGALAAMGLLFLMTFTGFGRAWRAYADDAKAAALFGIDGFKLLLTTLALAGAVAGLSGMLIVAQYGGLGFAGGFQFGLRALIAAIIGGIGSVSGALIGGIAVGLFETFWSAYLPIEIRDIALYAALVIFLIFKPGGLRGNSDLTPRTV